MSRRKITLIVALIILLLGGITAAALLYRNPNQAFDDDASNSGPSLLAVSILRDGTSADGELTVLGDCPEEVLATQEGIVTCDLQKPDDRENYQLRALSFFDFETDATYQIRLNATPSPEGELLVLKPGENLLLRVEIVSGQLTVKRQTDEGLIDFPPSNP